MPNENTKVTDEMVSREQKDELVKRTIRMLAEVLDKSPEAAFSTNPLNPTD